MAIPEIVLDTHNDLPWRIRKLGDIETYDFEQRHEPSRYHTDLPRCKEGGLTVQFWSVFVPTPKDNEDKISVIQTLEQIEITHQLIEKNTKSLKLCSTAEDARKAVKDGFIASFLGMEGGQSIGSNLKVLDTMYRLGCRYMTLTHNGHLPWADSHVAADGTNTALNNGLTDFGKSVVIEMQRIGMMVDLSHVSAETMQDAIDVAKAPVFFSHSNARAVCNNTRNVSDDILKQMADLGGVCQVTFVESFVLEENRLWCENGRNGDAPRATVQDVVDHIDHICKILGNTLHVGLGGDYDGCTTLPQCLHDVSCYPNVIVELRKRNYSDIDVKNICGENMLRMMTKCEQYAKEQV